MRCERAVNKPDISLPAIHFPSAGDRSKHSWCVLVQKNLQISDISLNLLVEESAKMPPLMILHPVISLHKRSFVHVFVSDMMLMEAIELFNK